MWWGQVNSRWWGWNTGQREREADSESRRELDGGEGARGRRKRIAAHNSVRRPAIRFVLDVSNRLARRSRERETVVHVFTFVRQLRLTKYSPGQNRARLARSIFLFFFFVLFLRSFPRRIVISSLARPSCLFRPVDTRLTETLFSRESLVCTYSVSSCGKAGKACRRLRLSIRGTRRTNQCEGKPVKHTRKGRRRNAVARRCRLATEERASRCQSTSRPFSQSVDHSVSAGSTLRTFSSLCLFIFSPEFLNGGCLDVFCWQPTIILCL